MHSAQSGLRLVHGAIGPTWLVVGESETCFVFVNAVGRKGFHSATQPFTRSSLGCGVIGPTWFVVRELEVFLF